MNNRFRRLRRNDAIRALIRETTLSPDDLIQPFFVTEGRNQKEPIPTMPGIYRYSLSPLLKAVEQYLKSGGRGGLFFGVSAQKDSHASASYAKDGVVQKALRAIKKEFPAFYCITDVCLCGYTDHGHCGILDGNEINNDRTLPVLQRMAVSHAEAGADMVAPSDMMDFRVEIIRNGLDENNFEDTAIMSYAVKYQSAFYGPFREAAHCAPEFGDRKTYQMDCANSREALKEARADIREGADIVMVKPALPYLDIISLLRSHFSVPIAAYHVSGEYAMIKAAAAKNWLDEKSVVLESLTSIKRAGSDIIISYYAHDVVKWLK